jgi:Tol biopolymer transport system component/dienelactone hydrolase
VLQSGNPVNGKAFDMLPAIRNQNKSRSLGILEETGCCVGRELIAILCGLLTLSRKTPSMSQLFHRAALTAVVCLGTLLCSNGLRGQDATKTPELTVEQIMADPDWIGRAPENPRWSHDGQTIYFQRKRKGSEVRDWFRRRIDPNSKTERVPVTELAASIPASGDFSDDYKRLAFSRDGDLFIADLATGKTRQLTRTSATESGVTFLDDDQRVQFRRDGAILIRHLRTGLESEPVIVRFEDEPQPGASRSEPATASAVRGRQSSTGGGSSQAAERGTARSESARESDAGAPDKQKPYIEQLEADLFEYLGREQSLREAAEEESQRLDDANTKNTDKPVYLGRGLSAVSQTMSSDARWLAVVVTSGDTADRGRRDQMPVWIRDDAYVESRSVRALVGNETESAHQLRLINIRDRKVIAVDLSGLPDLTVDRLAFLKTKPGAEPAPQPAAAGPTNATGDSTSDAESEKAATTVVSPAAPPRPRSVAIGSVQFSHDSSHLLFQCFSTDNKDRWIVSVPVAKAGSKESVRVLHHHYDEAWIGPLESRAGWIKNTHTAWFVSEATGFAHLYVSQADGSHQRQLTDGSFEVTRPQVSRDGRRIFFSSNETHPGIDELWAIDIESGSRTQLTHLGGRNEFELSPDEQSVVALHSEAVIPPELHLTRLESGATPRRLTRSTTEQFRAVRWTPPRFVEVPSRHGGVIHSRLYVPEDVASATEAAARTSAAGRSARPAVLFVHGAGYLQNAHQGWSTYFREFMFHSLLTRRGYVVLDMDYRASSGYGRDWRTAIYRQMGTPELEDLADGVEWLGEHHHVDTSRVGVYGGSYGGFLTLMALFRKPDLFACGAALRPVTDWSHYNHGYTSNILNTPDADPEAYDRSSPIRFADGLQNPLLICHGMIDDNVFFKDTVRLTQKLIELKKDNWNVAMYPVEPHAFRQPSSWRDEYQRILDLFERELALADEAADSGDSLD